MKVLKVLGPSYMFFKDTRWKFFVTCTILSPLTNFASSRIVSLSFMKEILLQKVRSDLKMFTFSQISKLFVFFSDFFSELDIEVYEHVPLCGILWIL